MKKSSNLLSTGSKTWKSPLVNVIAMDSINRPVLYVHAPEQCDICRGPPAQQYCDHEECRKFICDNCIPAHNVYKTHRSDFLKRVRVSEVDSKCYKPGHSERLACHMCVRCRKPLCDDCRDEHLDHDFTEIQSAVASVKTRINNNVDLLKRELARCQALHAAALDLEATVNQKFEEISKDVKSNIESVLQLVKDHESRILGEVEDERLQMLKDLRSSAKPLHDQTLASSNVIFEVQNKIDSGSATDILSASNSILDIMEEEVERARINDDLCLNPIKCRISRMRMIPQETTYDLGQVRCMWERVCSLSMSEVAKRSYIASRPDGGFVLGASHSVPQSYTSAADLVLAQSQDLVETSHFETKLSIYADNGKLEQTKDIGMLIGNEMLRGITVLPCGKIALLGKQIQIYDSDLKFLYGIEPVADHDWHSIEVGPSGSFLAAGDCHNDCIDILSAEGQIDHSIPCSGVKPWQLHAYPSGRYVISQPGIHESKPIIQILNRDGSIALSLSDKSWLYAYCSADSFGNVYIASLEMVSSKEDVEDTDVGTIKSGLTVARYTHRGKREEIILEDEVVENSVCFSIAAQKDGKRIALSSMDHLWIFK